ncbi:unnamed protein product [Camellia sinensis]
MNYSCNIKQWQQRPKLFMMHVINWLIEKQRLIEFAEPLRSKLKYFDELENMKNGKEFLLTNTVGFIQKLLPLGQPRRKFLSHPFWCMWWILVNWMCINSKVDGVEQEEENRSNPTMAIAATTASDQ